MIIENFDNWKCRCSALGKIMPTEAGEAPKKDGTPRKGAGKMSATTMTYLEEVFIGELYGVHKEAYGKPLDKGVACEQDSFEMINRLFYPGKFIAKIKEPTENAFIKGTADTIPPDGIIWDAKNAWDRFTFGKAEFHHDYKWQGRGYMSLYKKDKFRMIYTLINLPDYMVAVEENSLYYKNSGRWTSFQDTEYLQACIELREAHNYDSLSDAEKFKLWEIDRDPADDERIENAVIQARVYLNKLLSEHNELITGNEILIAEAKVKYLQNLKVSA